MGGGTATPEKGILGGVERWLNLSLEASQHTAFLDGFCFFTRLQILTLIFFHDRL